jgi:hypothetical protein
MFDNGTYRIIQKFPTNGKTEDRLVGRFYVGAGQFSLIEDPLCLFRDQLIDGPMDEAHSKVLEHLLHSGYYCLIHEDEINEGHYDDLLEDMDIGVTEPDAEYLLITGDSEPQRIDVYGNNFVVNGQKLSDEEADELLFKVHQHEYRMIPL